LRNVTELSNHGVVGAADPQLVYVAPDVLAWPQGVHPAPRDLRDSAADLVLSTNGLTR
jgi:hypothetical protein